MGLYRSANKALAERYFAPVPKFDYHRTLLLGRSCKGLACQHCGRESRTMEPAHSNWEVHGKGRGIKASDQFFAALCRACHAMLDQGSVLTEDEKKVMWWNAHRSTVRLLVAARRWPYDLPVPDVERCPWPDLPGVRA